MAVVCQHQDEVGLCFNNVAVVCQHQHEIGLCFSNVAVVCQHQHEVGLCFSNVAVVCQHQHEVGLCFSNVAVVSQHQHEASFSNMAVVCQHRHAVRFSNVAVVYQQRHEVRFNNVAVCMIRFCVWLISTPVSSTCEWLLLRLITVIDTRNKHCSILERRVNLWGRHFRAVIVEGELKWRQKLTSKCWKCPNIFRLRASFGCAIRNYTT